MLQNLEEKSIPHFNAIFDSDYECGIQCHAKIVCLILPKDETWLMWLISNCILFKETIYLYFE